MTEPMNLYHSNRRDVFWFFIVASIFSALLWLPLVLVPAESIPSIGTLWWLHYLGGLGPALAAIILTFHKGGIERLGDLLGKLRLSKNAFLWILLGGLLPIILLAFVYLFIGIQRGEWLRLNDLLHTEKLPSFGILGIVSFEILFFGLGEELGWRGYAWPRLRNMFGFFTSCLIITIPWALWHFPTFFYNPNMAQLGVLGTIGWAFSLLTGAVILGWLVDCAEGNVLPAVLFHGILDVIFVSKAIYGKYDSYLGIAVIILAIAIVLMIVFPKFNNLKVRNRTGG